MASAALGRIEIRAHLRITGDALRQSRRRKHRSACDHGRHMPNIHHAPRYQIAPFPPRKAS
jgi:hypothetical protein